MLFFLNALFHADKKIKHQRATRKRAKARSKARSKARTNKRSRKYSMKGGG